MPVRAFSRFVVSFYCGASFFVLLCVFLQLACPPRVSLITLKGTDMCVCVCVRSAPVPTFVRAAPHASVHAPNFAFTPSHMCLLSFLPLSLQSCSALLSAVTAIALFSLAPPSCYAPHTHSPRPRENHAFSLSPLPVYLRAVGGEVGATSTLAPKIGPLGLSPKKVGDDVAKATKDWKGLRVTVKLTVQNRCVAGAATH